jgi:hypothetical protein
MRLFPPAAASAFRMKAYGMVQQTVLISGLGIAGPTLAYWLKVAGFVPTLVESAPMLRRGGYIIDFWELGYARQRGAERFAGMFLPRTRWGLQFRNCIINAFAIPGLARLAIGRDIIDNLSLPTYDWPVA